MYTDDEDQPGREQVVVLSNRLWTRWFDRDRSVIGRRIRLNEQPYEVIGVMPARFDFTDESEERWVPVGATAVPPDFPRSPTVCSRRRSPSSP